MVTDCSYCNTVVYISVKCEMQSRDGTTEEFGSRAKHVLRVRLQITLRSRRSRRRRVHDDQT